MATEYLDKTGLVYFWGKIKAWVTERFVSDVLYDSTGHKITKTKNGSTSDVVTLDTIIQDSGALTASGVVNNGPTLAWSTESTIGSVGGVDLKVTMPANPGDTKVTLSAAITTDGNYPVILGYSTATTSVTNTVNKSSNLTYNPNTKAFVTGGTVDGYDLNDACAKAVDSSISENSTSTNLPTSQAVANAIANAIQSAQVGAAMFQGLTDLTDDGTVSTGHWKFSSLSDYKKGLYWVVASSGTYTGKVCEAGDMIFCVSDKSTSYSANDFNVVQTNLDITSITTSEIDTITSN